MTQSVPTARGVGDGERESGSLARSVGRSIERELRRPHVLRVQDGFAYAVVA